MRRKIRTLEQVKQREQEIENAIAFTLQLLEAAELRGMSPADCVASIVAVMAARDPKVTGEALAAVDISIRAQPVTKIITEVPYGPTH